MPHLTTYLGLAERSEQTLADSFREVAEGHAGAADVFHTCGLLAGWSDEHRAALGPIIERYGETSADEPERLHAAGLTAARAGEIGLLRDLQDLHVLASLVQTTWMVIAQAAHGLRDTGLLQVSQDAGVQTARQVTWLDTRIKVAAPQALIVE